jgi:ligand-binding sensor domain-containing protein/signal transduction histidine kinase
LRISNSSHDEPARSLRPPGIGGIRQHLAAHRFRARLTLFFVCLFLAGAACAIDPNRAMTQYLRDHWGPEQGFPWGPIYTISQTADGYLWIGTGAGLVRFDGFSFRLVKDDSGAFAITSVVELTPDNEGCLWLRLQDLTLLRDCTGAFENPSSAAGHNTEASAMTRTNRGEILISEPGKGALMFRGGGFRLLASVGDLSRTPVSAMAQTPNTDIWMGTREAGVFRFAQGGTRPIVNVLPHAKINCLLADGDRGLWIGTDDGVARWNGNELTSDLPATVRNFQALSMVRDRDGNLWVGTDSRGLLRFNSQGVANLKENDGVSQVAVTALFEDREGNLWTGSASGLERFRDSAFVTHSLPEGLPANGNHPVFLDSENRMWVHPAHGGLWWVKDGRHGRVSADGLDNDVVYSLSGRTGELWLGRQHGGLTRLRSNHGSFTAKSYKQEDGLAQNSVFSVYQARDGSVWAGTLSGGASKLTGETFTTYTIADGLASNTVISILESRDGTTWFATPSGLSALFKGRWQTYTRKDGLPSATVNCLLEDSSGVLWIGTTAGLAVRDLRGLRVPVGVPPSLQEEVLGMAEDRFGWLWMSTASHVLRVRRETLMRGKPAEGDLREFGPADGVRAVEGLRRHESVVTDSLGRIWFSPNRGISSVDPARLAQDSVPAIVHLLTISADNSGIGLGGSVHIPGGRKRITFGFTGLSLSSPEKVRFRYRLEGYDRDWSAPSAASEASYTNLSPGPYRFRVIASNPDGVWSNDEAAVGLQVDPLYWQSWWFAVIVVLAGASAVAAIYRMWLHQITRQLNIRFDERLAERTRLARELHDTLLQTIQGSKMVADAGLDDPADPGRAYRALERVSKWLAQATQEGRAALAALRSSATQRNDLAEALERAGEDCVFNTAMTFALTSEGVAREMHPMVRDEVYRTGYEAMRNACSHSQGTRLDVELTYARDLVLRIRDNGVGIDQRIVAHGKEGHFGLKGMKERAGRIGAKLRFNSTNSGTEVELNIPGSVAFRGEKAAPRGLLPKLRRFFRLRE